MKHHFIDEYAHLNGVLQQLDARMKIIVFFIYILLVNLTPVNHFFSFVYYALIILAWITLARIPLKQIIKKSLLISPPVLIFSALVFFYKHGLFFSLFSLIKTYLSLLTMTLLILTTDFNYFLKALRALKIPALFVTIFSFMYRYLFIISDELMRLNMAREGRTIKKQKKFQIRVMANIIGVLFVQSYEKSERVYHAMLARGFEGSTVKTIDNLQLTKKDYIFLGGISIIFSYIKIMENFKCLH